MYQPSLFAGEQPSFDSSFAGVQRVALDERSWVDYGQSFLKGADALFERIRDERPWKQRTRRMYEKEVLEPRLTAPWRLGMPLDPVLEDLRQSLNERYRRQFDTIGFNYYRDGNDSVAWHRDRIPREIVDPVVVLVSLGEPRRLMLRPRGGGRSLAFPLGGGDLLVTGGRAQRDWEHAILKVAHAGPRISLAFRHGTTYRG
jgi:alkylated DNA repair dioxygenase AlkB